MYNIYGNYTSTYCMYYLGSHEKLTSAYFMFCTTLATMIKKISPYFICCKA